MQDGNYRFEAWAEFCAIVEPHAAKRVCHEVAPRGRQQRRR